jgi:hypothetical protein
MARAMGAAVDRAALLDAMADDGYAAPAAAGRKLLDCALEAIEMVRLTVHLDDEGVGVFVTARAAKCHGSLL